MLAAYHEKQRTSLLQACELTLGVQQMNKGSRVLIARQPIFCGWKPSTSFSKLTASRMRCSLICLGRGSCTNMPCTAGSALKLCTTCKVEGSAYAIKSLLE